VFIFIIFIARGNSVNTDILILVSFVYLKSSQILFRFSKFFQSIIRLWTVRDLWRSMAMFSRIFSICLQLLGASSLDPCVSGGALNSTHLPRPHWGFAPGPRWEWGTSDPLFCPPWQILGYAPVYYMKRSIYSPAFSWQACSRLWQVWTLLVTGFWGMSFQVFFSVLWSTPIQHRFSDAVIVI